MPTTKTDFFDANPDIDVQVDFNSEMNRELTACLADFREGLTPQPGEVLVAGCSGATPLKVQVLSVTSMVVQLRVLD